MTILMREPRACLFDQHKRPMETKRGEKTFTIVSKHEMNCQLMGEYRRAHPENDYLEIFIEGVGGDFMGIGYLYATKRREVQLNDFCGRKECLVSNPALCIGCLGDECNDDGYNN
jgi:hypothetical protein